jgi:hypothetical protein
MHPDGHSRGAYQTRGIFPVCPDCGERRTTAAIGWERRHDGAWDHVRCPAVLDGLIVIDDDNDDPDEVAD